MDLNIIKELIRDRQRGTSYKQLRERYSVNQYTINKLIHKYMKKGYHYLVKNNVQFTKDWYELSEEAIRLRYALRGILLEIEKQEA